MSDLLEALRAFDGKAVTILSEARAKHGERPGFMGDLIKLIDSQEPYLADGATWLLKDCLESRIHLEPKDVAALIARLEAVPTWQAALHLCQIAEHLDLIPKQAKRYGKWTAQYLQHKRPFLRAWSMSALQYAATRSPDLVDAAEMALIAAGEDKAASVRARARQMRALF